VTEREWDRCTDPGKMLESFRGKVNERKLRLFAAACCRRLWRLYPWTPPWKLVDAAEQSADGLISQKELASWRRASGGLPWPSPTYEPGEGAFRAAVQAAAGWRAAVAARESAEGAEFAVREIARASALSGDALPDRSWDLADMQRWALASEAASDATAAAERTAQAGILRCIFGPLTSRLVAVDPAWLAWHGGAAVRLALAVYEERELPSGHLDRTRLAILADMLEEAGCADAELLGHLRSAGPHVRGCFAVDLLLDKS
jgi:hypothetical protein